MGIFRREETRDERPSPAAPPPPARTTIARGTRLEGLVGGSAEVEIEGEVLGQIQVEGLVVIGPHGTVQGPVVARVVRLAGRVHGSITASERVEVLASGALQGDVSAPRVTIAAGAYITGKVEMGTQEGREDPLRSPPARVPRDRPASAP